METIALKTKPRAATGTRASQKLRKAGLIPAILYGHKQEPLNVCLAHDDVVSALKHHARVVDLHTPAGVETAFIKDVQYDFLGRDVIHLDFERVDKDERIEVEVTIELKGTAPGASNGILEQPLHTILVECRALDIPESIKVNISTMQLGETIHVKELQLPAGVKALTDPELVVVHIISAKEEVLPAATGEGVVEPEIVGRRVAKDEAEE